jgi:hypothetical protein
MKTAEARLRDDLTHLGRLDGPVVRSVLLERKIKAVLFRVEHLDAERMLPVLLRRAA